MSTPECPKQFKDILGCGKTLIQLTVERFGNVCPQENMWVVTSEKYIDTIREQLPGIPESNILAEPCPRNTAPCIAYACWKIKKKYPVSGRAGFIPNVMIALLLSVNKSAFSITLRNSVVSITT